MNNKRIKRVDEYYTIGRYRKFLRQLRFSNTNYIPSDIPNIILHGMENNSFEQITRRVSFGNSVMHIRYNKQLAFTRYVYGLSIAKNGKFNIVIDETKKNLMLICTI